MLSLYDWVLKLGADKGFKNMTALCKAAGVPRANMTELKMGRSTMLSLQTAAKLAEALGVSTDYLLGFTVESQIDQLNESIALERSRLQNLSGEELEEAQNNIDAMTDQLEDLTLALNLSQSGFAQKEKPADNSGLEEYRSMLNSRPELQSLLNEASGMSKNQVEKMVDFLKSVRCFEFP